MPIDRTTNEMEFQGNVISWINAEILKRPVLGLELATQEPSKITRNRNDVVIWRNRASNDAFFTFELKTPDTPISDPVLFDDACQKAQKWNAPFFAIWNMQSAELYRTPPAARSANPNDLIRQFPVLTQVRSVDDWIEPNIREQLRQQAIALLDAACTEAMRHGLQFPIDASVFVDRLTRRIFELRAEVQPALTKRASRSRTLRTRLRQIAATQGFLGFVDDIDVAIAGQFCYRTVGQILFYFALRRKQPSLTALEPDKTQPFIQSVRPYWDNVRHFDYEALFEAQELDQLIPLTEHAQMLLYDLIDGFNKYDWNVLADDVLGTIFEQLIPRREQILLGQFYTPTPVADLLLGLALDGENPKLLDPGCGSGTFLLRSYQYLRNTQNLTHSQLLPLLWGFDISPFAAELATINLYRQNLTEFDNFPRILSGDFFQRKVGQHIDFPPARAGVQKKVTVPIPQFDAVVANPPYLRSQNQDDLDPKYKERLFALVAQEHGIAASAKTDLFAFFIYHAYGFLRSHGRLAFVTSASWLTADYGYEIQRFFLDKMRLVAVFASEAESFFNQVDQNTVLFVAEKRQDNESPTQDEIIRFVTLKKRLDELIPNDHAHWTTLQRFISRIDAVDNYYEDDSIRVRCLALANELEQIRQKNEPRNWSLPLRAPNTYFVLTEKAKSFVPLEEIADVHLGYKSLQNQFFYLDTQTIAKYGIEPEYVKPIYQLGDLQDEQFLQHPDNKIFLFHCNRPEADLRGTGALKYIRDMGNKPAAVKKQTGQMTTISEALAKQGGTYWYGPKAIPQGAHIWVRKAFDKTYSPFIFNQSQILDQRCNYLLPHKGIRWQALASILTSSIFTLSIEAAGSASMGAGALEIPTTKLSKIMVPYIRHFSSKKQSQLIKLANLVWEKDRPINWRSSSNQPSKYLRQLDSFLLKEIGTDISPDDIYDAIFHSLSSRMKIAQEKAKSKKIAESADILAIAKTILSTFKSQLESVRFPESFLPPEASTSSIEIDPQLDIDIAVQPFFEQGDVTITSEKGDLILHSNLPLEITNVLIHAILMGRRRFPIPNDQDVARFLMNEFWKWFPPLLDNIIQDCTSSSLGTKFEGEIEKAAMKILGWSNLVTQHDPYGHFRLHHTDAETQ